MAHLGRRASDGAVRKAGLPDHGSRTRCEHAADRAKEVPVLYKLRDCQLIVQGRRPARRRFRFRLRRQLIHAQFEGELFIHYAMTVTIAQKKRSARLFNANCLRSQRRVWFCAASHARCTFSMSAVRCRDRADARRRCGANLRPRLRKIRFCHERAHSRGRRCGWPVGNFAPP